MRNLNTMYAIKDRRNMFREMKKGAVKGVYGTPVRHTGFHPASNSPRRQNVHSVPRSALTVVVTGPQPKLNINSLLSRLNNKTINRRFLIAALANAFLKANHNRLASLSRINATKIKYLTTLARNSLPPKYLWSINRALTTRASRNLTNNRLINLLSEGDISNFERKIYRNELNLRASRK